MPQILELLEPFILLTINTTYNMVVLVLRVCVLTTADYYRLQSHLPVLATVGCWLRSPILANISSSFPFSNFGRSREVALLLL